MEKAERQTTQWMAAVPMRQFVAQYGVYISLLILMVAAAIATPDIYSSQTRFVILRQASQLGIVAIAQTLVLLVAGLDLSVSGVIVMTSVVIAEYSNGRDAALPMAMLLALAIGAVIGLGNGLLVTKRNVPPFIATLGMLALIQGAQRAYTKGIPGGFVPDALNVVNDKVGPVPVPTVIWFVLIAMISFLLYFTPYGRRVYAVGSNREAARLSGINVTGIVISIYVLCSVLTAIAGIILTGYVGYIDQYLGQGMDLDSIAAAIVGGTAFTGGRGNIVGTVAGVFLIQLLSTMTVQLGLDIQIQLLIKGAVIIAAVALYSISRPHN